MHRHKSFQKIYRDSLPGSCRETFLLVCIKHLYLSPLFFSATSFLIKVSCILVCLIVQMVIVNKVSLHLRPNFTGLCKLEFLVLTTFTTHFPLLSSAFIVICLKNAPFSLFMDEDIFHQPTPAIIATLKLGTREHEIDLSPLCH